MAYCAVTNCNNSVPYKERAIKADHVKAVKFHQPYKKRYSEWNRILQKDTTPFTKVCSNHFVDGRPTKENPDPTLYLKGYDEKENMQPARKRTLHTVGDSVQPYTPLKVTKRRQVVHDHTYRGMGGPIVITNEQTDTLPVSPVRTSAYSVAKMQDEHNYCSDESKSSEIVLSPKTGIKMAVAVQNQLKEERDAFERSLNFARSQMQNFKTPVLNIELMIDDDHAVKLHTGLPSYDAFMYLYNQLEYKIVELEHYAGSHSEGQVRRKSDCCKRGPPRALDPKTEMLITLMKLRLNLMNEYIAYRFKISPSLVSKIITTWIIFLGLELKEIIVWPKFAAIKQYYPKCFERYENVACIIDCTEVDVQRPSLAASNGQVYSKYKGRSTAKVLIGCMPGGSISFVSDAFSGSISDRDIVVQSDLLQKLETLAMEANEKISLLADRGFNIQDLLLKFNVKLEIPPFLRQILQFSTEKARQTKQVANTRVHIERVIGRLKEFRIFKSTIPSEYYDMIHFMFIICSAIVNLNPPIVSL